MERDLGRILFVDFSLAGEKARMVQKIFDCTKGYRELKSLKPDEYHCRLIKRLSRKNGKENQYWLILVQDPAFGLPLAKARMLDRAGTISITTDADGNAYFEN